MLKKHIIKVFAFLLCAVMLVTCAPLDGFVFTAEAAGFQVGDIIEFGMYPQKRIEASYFDLANIDKIADGSGCFEYKGQLYKKETDGAYFIFEPIKWRVLSVNNTGILVVAENILDYRQFHNTRPYPTWANSDIREWLNNDFYNMAFSSSAKMKIATSLIATADYAGYDGGVNTYDKIFLLSRSDVSNSSYGFPTGTFDDDNDSREACVTEYTAFKENRKVKAGDSSLWWLRNPASDHFNAKMRNYGASFVDEYGDRCGTDTYFRNVVTEELGVRPALKIKPDVLFKDKSYNSYAIKTIENIRYTPISGVNIVFDGKTVGTTAVDGTFILKIGANENLSKTVSFIKNGYSIETRSLYELNSYVINNIPMQNGFDISQLLSKLQFEKETVTGPQVTILGKTFSLFSFDAGINIKGFSFKQNQNTKEKTIKYIIGIKDGVSVESDDDFNDNYYKMKDFFKGFSSSESGYNHYWKYQNFKDKLEKLDGSVGFDAKLSVAGYMEFDYSTGELVYKEGGMVVTAEADVSQDIPFWGVCYATFKIGGEVEGKLNLQKLTSGEMSPGGSFGIKVKPSIGVGAKLLSKDVASIELGINGSIGGSITLPASALREALSLDISAACYVKAKALWVEASWSKTLNMNLYPNFGDITINSAENVIDYNDFEPIARDYLNAIQIETQSIDETLNKYSVYPYADPQLVELNDGRIVALWLGDNGTKSTMNLTTLYYSVYESGTWSAPAAVYESGLADNEPKIATDGEKVYALWQRGNEVFTDDSSLDYMLAHIDLVYSEFDGEWTKPIAIGNSGSGMYPIAHGIAAENNTVAITWAENSKNFAEGTDGVATIFSQILTDDVWSEVQEKDQCDNISSLAIGYYYGEPMVAYTVDTDGDTTTKNDNELFLDSMQITYDDVDDYNVTYQNGQFYYLSDGYLSCFDSFIDGDLYVGNDYKVLSNGMTTAVVYPVTDGYHSELYVAYEENDGYSSPVALTSIGKHIADYSAIIDSENTIVAAMAVRNIDENATGYPYTSTDFIVDNIGQLADLEMSEIVYYDIDSVVAGNKLTFTTTIKNIGTAAVNGYTVNFKDLSGTLVAAREYDGGIASGETIEATVIYTLPDDFRKQTFTVEVVANDDGNESNNTATVEIGCADIEVVSCEIQDGKIVATVTNKGYETVTGAKADISRFTTQSNILGTIAIGEIEPGEVETIEYILPASQLAFDTPYSSNRFIIEVKSDTEEISSVNNSAEVLYSPKAVEAISLNTSELTIDIGSTHQLLATVAPFDAYNKVVHWVSDSTNIVEVDEYTGELTAVSGGTAIITAITDDGGYVSQCVVTVNVPVSGIELDKTSIIIGVGRSSSVTVSFTPENASNKNILWSSADTNIVTVNNGEIFGKNVGETIVTAKTKDGNYTAMCIVRVIEVLPSNDSKTVVDNINKHIYGLDAGIDSLDNYVTVSNEDCVLEYEPTKKGFGTGTIVLLTINGEIVDNYTVVIFGDVNGDGWYDGEDAFMVNLIAQGILDEDDVGTAIWTAADCNHDGVINELDVDLLTGAGLLLNNVDQSATAVEFEPNAAYIEYMGLIDQNFSIGTDNSTAQPDNETTASEFDFEIIIAEVFEFIKSILVFIFSFIV